MRLFLIGWGESASGLMDVVSALHKNSHEIIYWVVMGKAADLNKRDWPGTIIHSHFDALLNIPPAEIKADDWPPVGDDLIKKLYETESIVLTMMNKRFEFLGLSERKHFYYELLRYWHGIISKFKPDVIIFTVTPHTVYDFIIYSLAKLLQIKTVMFETIWIGDRLLVLNDYMDGSDKLRSATLNLRAGQTKLEDISPDIRSYYQQHSNPNNDLTPSYEYDRRRSYAGADLAARKLRVALRAVRDGTIIKKTFLYLARKLKGDLKTEYLRLQVEPDFSRPYIYVPLNYQPERTTSPQGGTFVDQLLMVEILSAAVPDGWVIYVKEHPSQWLPRGTIYFSYRYRGYYAALAKLKNVKIIPIQTDTNEAINQAQAVATVTGTAGWESVLRLKPALVFGYPWYQHCPGVFRVSDVASAAAAIKAITGKKIISEQEILNYLRALDQASWRGYLDPQGEKISSLPPVENTTNILNALISAIET